MFSNTRAAILKRIKLDYFLIPYTKVNSKWLKGINVRPETIKHQEENTGSTLFYFGLTNIILDMSPQKRKIKAKLNRWDLIKHKRFYTMKETISKKKKRALRLGEYICI